MQPYNTSAMYEDSMLPVYVDYIGSIMPILDRQSIATNWPPTPHPNSGQVRIMPYNSANLPTVPYLLNVGSSRLLPEPIRRVPALSEIALGTPTGLQSDSVSQVGVIVTQAPPTMITPYVTFPLSIQSMVPATTPQNMSRSVANTPATEGECKDTGKSPMIVKHTLQTDMKQTVPYIYQTQREIPFTDFIIPVNPPVMVSTVYTGQTLLLSEKDYQMCLVKLESVL